MAGFTIIETLLFLGVTGLLVLSILTGVGISVNTQRYRDSVDSFKSLVQQQYNDLKNVYNDRTGGWTCTSGAVTVEGGSLPKVRGQSDCVLLGKYISINDQSIAIATVVGYEIDDEVGTDIDTIKNNYELGLSSVNSDTKELDWGTRIAWPLSGENAAPAGASRSLGILIIQSPISNTVYTFTSDAATPVGATSSTQLKNMLVTANAVPGQAARTICIDADGLSISGNSAVYIAAYATNASSVETRSNDVIRQLGGTSQC